MTQLSGAQLQDGSVTAAKLAPGAAGTNIFTGEGAPSNTLGIDGDFYIDTYAGYFYGPKAAGSWPSGFPSGGTAMSDRDPSGRLRVSNPKTLFDSKLLFDAQPLLWDDQEVSGAGTTSIHSTDLASVVMGVTGNVAGKRVRQTFQRFNYQSGKGQRIELSGQLASAADIVCEVGYFDDDNGVCFRTDDGVVNIVKRSHTSGAPVDTVIPQSAWDDPMDGTGPSGITLDIGKVQLFAVDFAWYGVASIRFALQIDGTFHTVHQLDHANTLTTVFMSNPNLPLRYSIENKGAGAAASMQHICATVISEGGHSPEGILSVARNQSAIASLSSGTAYAMLGMKLKTSHISAAVILEQLSALLPTSNDTAYWELRLNPTVNGTFTYVDTDGAVAVAAATSNANTVSGGRAIQGGFFQSDQALQTALPNALRIGSNIAGVRDELVLCITPTSGSLSAQAAITWRELS